MCLLKRHYELGSVSCLTLLTTVDAQLFAQFLSLKRAVTYLNRIKAKHCTTMSSTSGARFDYDQHEKIRQQQEFTKRMEELKRRGPPQIGTLWYAGCGMHLFAGFIVVLAIAYASFANYPEPPLSPILFQWKAMGENSTTYTHKGYNIFYVDKVNELITDPDLTLVYLHGFPTSSFDLHMIFTNLTRNFRRIIAPDLIGFGFSDKPRFYTYSLLDQTELIINLIKMLNLKKVHILSHDYGDSIAQELLARVGEKALNFEISSVCMMNGGVFPSLHKPIFTQRLLRTPIIGTVVSKMANYLTFSLSFSSVFGPNTQPAHDTLTDSWKLIRLQDGYRVWGSILAYIDERFTNEDRWVGALRNAPVPVHFIYGPEDPVNPKPIFEQTYRGMVASPSLTVLPDIGHYPLLEDPEEVSRSYLNFLLIQKMIPKIE